MSTTNRKSIVIEGDKAMFASKGAVDRLKRDLREDNKERLNNNDYLREGWTYKILSNTDTEMKIQLVHVKDVQKQPRVLECDERRKMLKEKLKLARMQKLSPSQLKLNLKNKVPADVLDAYLELKKVQLKVPVPSPEVVLSKPDEFRNIIHTMVQSFGMFKGNNNPVINYYRLLAKHLGLPTTFVPPNPQQDKPMDQTNEFIEMLRKQRNEKVEEDVDDEMKKIYESLGIEVETKDTKEEVTKEEETDDEMKKIYESLGIQMKDSTLEV
jgi:hypothetical protein